MPTTFTAQHTLAPTEVVQVAGRTLYVARCACGWESLEQTEQPAAVIVGAEHVSAADIVGERAQRVEETEQFAKDTDCRVLLSAPFVAGVLYIPVETLDTMRALGVGPRSYLVGRERLYLAAEVEAYTSDRDRVAADAMRVARLLGDVKNALQGIIEQQGDYWDPQDDAFSATPAAAADARETSGE